MIRPILAALITATIALMPAERAAADDGNRLLGLAIGAAAIYAVIEAEKRKKEKAKSRNVAPSRKATPPKRFRDQRCTRRKRQNGRWVTYQDRRCQARQEQRKNARALRGCERQRWGRDGWETYYDRRCLDRKGLVVSGGLRRR